MGYDGYLALLVEKRNNDPDLVTEARLVRYGVERGLVARFRSTGQIDRFAYCLYDKDATVPPAFNDKGSQLVPTPRQLVDLVVLYYTAEGRTRIALPSPMPYDEFGSFTIQAKVSAKNKYRD